MNNVAIIPARGNSVRIPNKNIRNFCGKPMIAYSIELALKSNLFERVIVSTDNQEIAKLSMSYGAEVPFIRPDELADDYTGTSDVIAHAVTELEKQGDILDLVCCIYATAPFLELDYLNEGLNQLKASSSKRCSFSVGKFNYPVQRAFTIDAEKNLLPLEINSLAARSQDLEEVYHDAAQFYWASAKDYQDGSANFFSSDAIPIILPKYLVQDIDDEDDWKRAELMYIALHCDNETTDC